MKPGPPDAVAAIVALVVVAALGAMMRPLLLATLDGEVAALRGVPVRALGAGFLALLAAVTAESTQAVGALLLRGLLAAPAGAAHLLTTRPYRGLALSGAIAVASVWAGLALAYAGAIAPTIDRDHRVCGGELRGDGRLALGAGLEVGEAARRDVSRGLSAELALAPLRGKASLGGPSAELALAPLRRCVPAGGS